MKPSEVITMRDRLAWELTDTFGFGRESEIADWLIEAGWVTEVPEVDNE